MPQELPDKIYNAISGNNLLEEIIKSHIERPALIEGFLHEHSSLMLAADPGVGKSVLMICAFAQASAGLPVFNKLMCSRPLRCYYIPFERGMQEAIERLKCMKEVVPFDYDNLFINENFVGLDVTNSKHADLIIKIIQQDCPEGVDIVGIDPIYASVSGGLSTDEKASSFCRFSARLQQTLKCSVWLNHHTVKQQVDQAGKTIERSDPFYGSQWLKAHVTASYHMKQSKDGILLENKKDSHGNLIKKINLGYNQEFYTCYAVNVEDVVVKKDRALVFLRTCFQVGKSFYFSEFFDALGGVNQGVSTTYARRLLCTPPLFESIIRHKTNGERTLYEVIKKV